MNSRLLWGDSQGWDKEGEARIIGINYHLLQIESETVIKLF